MINGDFIESYRSKTENTTRDGTLPIKVPISNRIKEIMDSRRGKQRKARRLYISSIRKRNGSRAN